MKISSQGRLSTGFSLIELLVVLSVIAILASIFMGGLWPSIDKADDSKRIADIDQLGVAARLYFERYGEFPDYSQDIGVGNDVDDDLGQFIRISADRRSPEQDYHYDSDYNCPLAGGSGTVIVYAVLIDESKGNWQTICDSDGPAEQYGIVINPGG